MKPRLAAGIVFAGLLAASCGNGKSILEAGNEATTTTLPASTVPGQTTVPPTTTTTPLSDLPPCPVDALATTTGVTEVTFWHGLNGVLETTLGQLTDEYNASQDKVRVSLQNQGGYEQTIEKYLPANQDGRPDLVQFPEYMVQSIRDTDSAVPVEACMEAEQFDTSDFLDRALGAYTTESIQWSMPFNVSDPILYFLKPKLAAAGLDPENPPVSLDDLRAASQAIVDSGQATYGIALDSGADSGGGWFIEQWFANAGELFADNDNGRTAPATRVLFDNPKGIEMLTYLQQLIDDGLAVTVGDNASGQDNFLKLADAGSPAAMTIGTSAALGQVLSVLDQGLIPGLTADDVGTGPMPGPSGVPGALVGGASLWIVDGKSDAVTAASWDYVKFLVSAQSQSTWAAATGYVPVREGALELEPLKTTYATDPRFRVAYDQLLATAEDPSANGPILGPQREIRGVAARMIAEIFNGADVAATLTSAAAQANALLADYSARN